MTRFSRKSAALYDSDFNAWLEEQAAHARAGRSGKLDLVHLAEELEGLDKSQRHEIENRLRVLLVHLLKHEAQPALRTRGWLSTIAEQRDQIAIVLRDSPSLRSYPRSILPDAHARAVRMAAIETGLSAADFPPVCPWPVERVLEEGWLP